MDKFSLDCGLIPNEQLTRHCLSRKYYKDKITKQGLRTWCLKDGIEKETDCLYGNCDDFKKKGR